MNVDETVAEHDRLRLSIRTRRIVADRDLVIVDSRTDRIVSLIRSVVP